MVWFDFRQLKLQLWSKEKKVFLLIPETNVLDTITVDSNR